MYKSDFNIKGIRIGHHTDEKNGTGTTVILCDQGAVIGASVRGSAPGTRETDLAHPMNMVQKAHAVFLSGGSAYGLDCAGGIMAYLEKNNVGFQTDYARVPIVLGAVLYDLGYKNASVRPDDKFGYRACEHAKTTDIEQGSIGAGTGATCGKILGMDHTQKSGIGLSSIDLGDGVIVVAVIAANPMGDIYDYEKNLCIAGQMDQSTVDILLSETPNAENTGQNTTIGAVITNAKLDKAMTNKMADIAHDGLALSIRPCHTMVDGDTMFGLSTGEKNCDINRVLNAATIASARAIANAIYAVKGIAK